MKPEEEKSPCSQCSVGSGVPPLREKMVVCHCAVGETMVDVAPGVRVAHDRLGGGSAFRGGGLTPSRAIREGFLEAGTSSWTSVIIMAAAIHAHPFCAAPWLTTCPALARFMVVPL